ncbi:MAG: ATP-dependent DNA ligase [Actinobacteria bacterium]|nr:ATP-dependent DNA ligase [Actinomycetota bacterium]
MDLPLPTTLAPMLAKAVDALPEGSPGEWWFEPKWDGFRCTVFRDGDDVVLGSRNERPMTRYFPELLGPLRDALPPHAVVDGEIVVATEQGLDFDLLGQRIHPAESRIRRLAEETPASFVAFDLLYDCRRNLLDQPFAERRTALEAVLAGAGSSIHLTPATTDRTVAERWFTSFEGAGLDGVVAKRASSTYEPDKRGWLKIKHQRTADVVVAGYRVHKDGEGVGSLLLGLYDGDGQLHHVGVAASFTAAKRRDLLVELEPLALEPSDLAAHPWGEWAEAQAHAAVGGARLPGAVSRWNAKKDLSWVPIPADRVAEVAFERVDHGRFRHTARFQRWRPDRVPASCTFEQVEVVPPIELREVFGA